MYNRPIGGELRAAAWDGGKRQKRILGAGERMGATREAAKVNPDNHDD